MQCQGRTTRTGEIECTKCHRTWDRTDEAPECRPAPVFDETGPGGILDAKTVRLGLGYKMGRTRDGQSAFMVPAPKRKPRD